MVSLFPTEFFYLYLSNLNYRVHPHRTALHSASVNGNTPTVQELINLGGVVDAATDKGQTPLHVATYAGSLETVTALIRAGAYVNAVTSFERMTPLHIACQRNWKDVAKYLITKGADVHALNIIERTPLHFAAAVGRTDLGVVLLQAGAKSDAMDIHGWTPRQVAELHDNRSFQELMVQANMPEKQPVIKELPPAAWHGELWASMIEINKEKRAEAEKDRRRVERTAEEVKIAIRRERKRELDNWTTASYLSSIKEAETFSDSISMLSTTSSSAMDMLHSTAPDSGAGVVHAVRKGALNATAAAVPRRSKLAESAVRQLGVRR